MNLDFLLTETNLTIVIAVWSAIQAMTRALPKVFESPAAKRLKPGASIVLCIAVCMIPGVQPDEMPEMTKLLVGIILGNAVSHAHKILKHTFLGGEAKTKVGEKARKILT